MNPSSKFNEAIYESSVAFDPQLAQMKMLQETVTLEDGRVQPKTVMVPPAISFPEEGKVYFSFYAPGAKTVEILLGQERFSLKANADGLFETVVETNLYGFQWLFFYVDGVEVLNPLAPVGYGYSHPVNYVEIPDPEGDFFALKNVPHGAVREEVYYSKAMGLWKRCLVYVPAEYEDHPEKDYPVLYLQHGHGENEIGWVHQGKMNLILDNLIAEGKAEPMLVVMNNGMTQKDVNGTRAFDVNNLQKLLLTDCIPFIEAKYRAKTDKWNRAMAGLSMGSMQTSVTTLSHPELFSYAGVFSGFVSPLRVRILDPESTAYMNTLKDKEAFNREYKVFFRATGKDDRLLMSGAFEKDREIFKEAGLSPEECPAHIEKIYEGSHEWNVWRRSFRDFAKLLFRE